MTSSSMHRQVFILAAAQAIFQTASVLVMTIGGLAGAKLASSPGLATLPIGTMFLGTAVMTFPASMWMSRVGRRPGFVAGAVFGGVAGLLAALGVWAHSMVLLCFGTFLVGAYQAFAQFYRFAASEVATDEYRPRAISYVLAGGVIAAFAGPYLARLGSPAFDEPYVGSFLLLALVSLIGASVLLGLKVPPPIRTSGPIGNGRRWIKIVTQPAYAVALFAAATASSVMIFAMTATPLAMMQHQHSLSAAVTVIQLHVLGMFLPSLFTGRIVARFGPHSVMLGGIVILTCHVLTTLTGTGFGSFAAALMLLGLGWNFLFVGATTLLTETYTEAERGRAQATNDMTIFIVGLSCSFGAGALLNALGWAGLNLLTLPWLAAAAGAITWHAFQKRSTLTLSEAALVSEGQSAAGT